MGLSTDLEQNENEQIDLSIIRTNVDRSLSQSCIAILPRMDVLDSIQLMKDLGIKPRVTILDPWYNKGFGDIREDYDEYILNLLIQTSTLSDHVFLWGFPEIIARFITKIPEPLRLVAWLTWYYKNNPSVIRGWRSSQNACLHLAQPNAKLYPEHFLNEAQKQKLAEGKLRYLPGPTSVIEGDFEAPADVIEAALLVGFVGKKEQTGHPSQKPVSVFERIILMTTIEGDLIFDPMAGSGTTGMAALRNQRKAIVADHAEEYIQIMENRLMVKHISRIAPSLTDSAIPPNFYQSNHFEENPKQLSFNEFSSS